MNRRSAVVIGFQSLQISDISQFFVPRVFQNSGDSELNRAFAGTIPRSDMPDFIIVTGNHILKFRGKILIFFEVDIMRIHGILNEPIF